MAPQELYSPPRLTKRFSWLRSRRNNYDRDGITTIETGQLRSRRDSCDRDGTAAIETGELRSRRENYDRDGRTGNLD
ncbi:MAG: hypothetical protein QNJ54_36475 [Prochloraceae cyanobacterium]|nr:hypothetical protein [Prochloraceae cyanobacterium]